jgi:benzoate/toluate 1,2-dioxygenase beta subunit/2,4,5-trichlorophenoxyacetic acid oxygenase 2
MREALEVAMEVVAREGHLLDRRAWDDWLAMYRQDAVYWVPAWRNESETVEDPDTEVSLIYHDSRVGLEERVQRLRTGKSVTTMPLLRTAHFVSSFLVAAASLDKIDVHSSWQVVIYQPRSAVQHTLAGRYEHELVKSGEGWKIARKKIILINDRVPTLVDFYCL